MKTKKVFYHYKALRKAGPFLFGNLLTMSDYASLTKEEKKNIQELKSPIERIILL
jgi:hypothetical protein